MATSNPAARESPDAKSGSLRALNALNFFLADVQTGIGPFLVVFLTTQLRWKPGEIGLAMGISGLVGVLAQIPAGAFIDATRHKRLVMVVACAAIAVASLTMAYFPNFMVVTAGQSAIAFSGAIFGPAIAAITLGLVGRKALDRQVGKNQTINSLGNVVNAIALGLCGYYAASHGLFWFVAVISIAAVVCAYGIRHDDIDDTQARGGDRDKGDVTPDGEPGPASASDPGHVSPIGNLFRDRRILIFAASAILFHFANGGLGPLVSQVVARQVGTRAMLYQSAMTIASQVVVAALGWWIGKRASGSLRKPLYLVAFAILPIRAGLYLLTRDPNSFVVIQAFDGVGAGIFGIMQLLVVADLTKGTGRFNLTQGALATAVGVGASLSNVVGGYLVRAGGFGLGFATMAIVALLAFLFFWRFMPETKLGHETPGSVPAFHPAYVA